MRAKFPSLVILGALLVACSDAPAPTAPADLSAGDALFTVLEGEGAVYVLNAQLRPVASTDFTPSTAWGHIQVKLRAHPPDPFYSVSWQGGIINPDKEPVVASGIFFGVVPPSDGIPPIDFDDNHVVTENTYTPKGLNYGESDVTLIESLFGMTLTAAQAEDMIASPGDHFAWFGTDEGAIAGVFDHSLEPVIGVP
ncbi:MAG: hypothetical protein ACYTA3_04010 [Planctomycetota bacterium]|jgi:hypothetical protein